MKPILNCISVLILLFSPSVLLAQRETVPKPEEAPVSALSAFANSDPNYRALRDGEPKEAIAVQNLTLTRDVATFTLRTGQVTFLRPVLGRRALAVFTGQGNFHLNPVIQIEEKHLEEVTGRKVVDEDFDSALFVFSDRTYEDVKKGGQAMEPSPEATRAFDDLRKKIRKRGEENLEAGILGDLYNPSRAGSFCVFLHGKKHPELHFLLRPGGAVPEISPEEVAVIQEDYEADDGGIWYLTHRAEEWLKNAASSGEEKRIVEAEHYNIETVVDKHEHLHATAEVRLKALANGDRVIPFGLLSALRVSEVQLDGKDIAFLQEGRKQDGSFSVILPEPSVMNREYTLRVDYEGDRVLRNEGGGTFSVGARTSWYPSLNAFHDHAVYQLTFKVPHQCTLVSIGKLVKESREGDYAVTEWNSEVPVPVAGFNYGYFKKKERQDDVTHYRIEAYATRELPDYMRSLDARLPGEEINDSPGTTAMSPSALAESALVDAENAIRCFEAWFGPTPFHRIAITQQPEFNFGQSWPTLVYLPVSAFLDSTQRWRLMGQNAFQFADFIQEVTPHEVSHQWWGHTVGWASYRDQWLSEGFADFSAAIYLERVGRKSGQWVKYWERAQRTILEKNQFGRSAEEAGPLWMGFRLNTAKSRGAYNRLVYPKGGYVLYMLRGLMWDRKTGDKDFIDLMHDFVAKFQNRNASTEDFERVVEQHMKPALDLDRNGTMRWFFKEWVYGTDVPAYRLKYSLTPAAEGKTLLTANITQAGVPDNFRMLVPIYLDFDGTLVRAGSVSLSGTTPQDIQVLLPRKPKRVLLNALHDVLASESVSEGS